MKLYQITVHFTRPGKDTPWKVAGSLPTFYLRDDMQGIVDAEHATLIARHMLTELAPDATFHIGVGVSDDFPPGIIGA